MTLGKTQKGGSCGMGGVCSIQMGGRKKTKRTRKQRAGGCGCGSSTTKQFGGRTKKRHSKKKHSKKH